MNAAAVTDEALAAAEAAPVAVVLLARHGQSDWNRERRWQGHADRPLTELGIEQAALLAERLSTIRLDAVYSSDLRRAHETAETVAARQGLEVRRLPQLREVDVGSWSGLTWLEAAERFPDGFRRWEMGKPGWDDGESYTEMAERVVAAVEELARRHPREIVLVVAHAGPIRAVHATTLGMDIHSYRRIRPVEPNARLTAVCYQDGRLTRLCPAGEIDDLLREEELAGMLGEAPPPSPAG